jgi:threonine synthase
MAKFISEDEIPTASLAKIIEKSYATFDTSHVTPLVKMSDDGSLYLLEQFHGPTCAFKDVALQVNDTHATSTPEV